MALGDILGTIRAESRASVLEILASAEAEANRILARAREEAAGEEQRLATSRDDQARLERSRIISRAHLEAARERRGAREEVYLAAVEGVTHRIESLRASPEYEEVFARLLDEAIAVLPEATAIRVDPADAELASRIVAAQDLDVLVEHEESPLGGVVVVAVGRAVDNNLRSRLDRADEHLRFTAGELIPGVRGRVR
jgi:V/A-type H+-transporting ATPase subunit E